MNPAPQKPRLYLPVRPSKQADKNAIEEDQGNREAEAAATLSSIAMGQSTTDTATAPILGSNASENHNADAQALQKTLQQLGEQRRQKQQTQEQGVPLDRDFPPGVHVARGEEQGLATGMFCPLCLGDLYQFLVSEKRGFVMCPDRQCVFPFNLPREELQSYFTALPNICFRSSEDEGKE